MGLHYNPVHDRRAPTKPRRRSLPFEALLLLALTFPSLTAPLTAHQPDPQPLRPPNIVLILADDLGIGDVGVYGAKRIRTPHIDALAAGGVRLESGYVSAPVCSPSRAGLLTGRYQQRHGWELNTAGMDRRIGLDLGQRTLADMLRAAGYRTGIIGKWHLGQPPAYRPLQRGFDEYFGILEGGSTYIDSRVPGTEYAALAGERAPTERGNTVYRGEAGVEVEDYLTDAFTREALAFIERHSARHRARPFFLYLSYTAPHTPLQATREYLDRYRDLSDPRARVYAAMVAALDDGVGAVVAKLRQLELLENTLLVFLSDNGCASYVRGACSNQPHAGFKRYHLEGGLRVPFVFHWPAKLPSGSVYRQPAISLDLFATFAAAAGSEESTEDSIDLLPYLRGERQGPPHRYLFWRSGPTVAVRAGGLKLARFQRSELDLALIDNAGHALAPGPGGTFTVDESARSLTVLYDLAADPDETRNLAAGRPQEVARLQSAINEWQRGLIDPLWPPRRSTLARIDGEIVQLFYWRREP